MGFYLIFVKGDHLIFFNPLQPPHFLTRPFSIRLQGGVVACKRCESDVLRGCDVCPNTYCYVCEPDESWLECRECGKLCCHSCSHMFKSSSQLKVSEKYNAPRDKHQKLSVYLPSSIPSITTGCRAKKAFYTMCQLHKFILCPMCRRIARKGPAAVRHMRSLRKNCLLRLR